MERYQERPPTYVSHSPEAITLPPVPQHDFTHPHAQPDLKLPDLKTVLSSPDFRSPNRRISNSQSSPIATSVRSLPPIDAFNAQHAARGPSVESAVMSPNKSRSVIGAEDSGTLRSTTTVSMDDPDVRMAAEALSGLGNPGMSRHYI